MKFSLKSIAALAVISASASAYAGLTEADGLGIVWVGTPSFNTYSSAVLLNNPNGAFSPEGGWGTGGSGSSGGLAQGFTLTSGGALNNIQLTMSGGVASFNVFLYDFGLFSSYTQGGSATYTPGVSLLTSGLQFTYNAGAGGALNVVQLSFNGADNVNLLANEEYILALEPTAAIPNTTFWSRGGGTTTGLYGQGYRLGQFNAGQYGAINGSTPAREFGLAVTLGVPEPSTMAVLGLGTLVSTFAMRRSRKS